jgi:hypothetical protein
MMLLENTQRNSEETEERQNEVIVCLSYIHTPIQVSIYYKIYIKILWIRGLYCNIDSSFYISEVKSNLSKI